jgi:uncharacterized membrane protein YphA (DoxX/SURF4 family)
MPSPASTSSATPPAGDRGAVVFAPMFLRVALAVIFLWTGLGKALGDLKLTTEQAATLASVGGPKVEGESPVVRKMWEVALVVHAAAQPTKTGESTSGPPVWPAELGKGRWPAFFAVGVTVVQLAAGVLLVAGFLTRWAAGMLGAFLLGAMWLTEIGPAVQSGTAVLGFLPAYPTFEEKPWMHLWLQFALLCTCLAVVFAGSGGLAVDRALRLRRHRKDFGDEL